MSRLGTYFRRHRWQRRTLTALLTVVVAALLAIWLYPHWQERELLDELQSTDAQVRREAIVRAARLANERPRMRDRLRALLASPDEETFLAARLALRLIGECPAAQDSAWMDRADAIRLRRRDELSTAPARRQIIIDMLLAGRNNRYVREALRNASSDSAPGVRAAAAMLAAKMGDNETLRELLDDDDLRVASAAALDAGLTGRTRLAEAIRNRGEELLGVHREAWREYLRTPESDEEQNDKLESLREFIASAAYALALLDAPGRAEWICGLAEGAEDPELRDRLFIALTLLDEDRVHPTIMEEITRQRFLGELPSAMALQAAARLRIAEAGPAARDVLAAAVAGEENLREAQVIAAIHLADAVGLAAEQELMQIIRRYWQPGRPLLLMPASRLLGRQLVSDDDSMSARREEALQLLRDASLYAQPQEEGPAVPSPLASAAAAVALWRLEPGGKTHVVRGDPERDIAELTVKVESGYYVAEAASSNRSLAGDYVAWHIGRSERPEAFELGQSLCPAYGGRPRQYSESARTAGALMLAFAASTPPQKETAIEQISSRLPVEEPFARHSMQCALYLLGRDEFRETLEGLWINTDFPTARLIKTLLSRGDKHALDMMLLNMDLADVENMLSVQGVGEVLAVVAPQLPGLDTPASRQTRRWQCRILRHTWVLHRDRIELGLEP